MGLRGLFFKQCSPYHVMIIMLIVLNIVDTIMKTQNIILIAGV